MADIRQQDRPIPTRRFSSAKGEQPAWLTLALANRHGLVTGATGTGKTVSLQVMAEGFARAGVPVFAADIKGDSPASPKSARPRISSSSGPAIWA